MLLFFFKHWFSLFRFFFLKHQFLSALLFEGFIFSYFVLWMFYLKWNATKCPFEAEVKKTGKSEMILIRLFLFQTKNNRGEKNLEKKNADMVFNSLLHFHLCRLYIRHLKTFIFETIWISSNVVWYCTGT